MNTKELIEKAESLIQQGEFAKVELICKNVLQELPNHLHTLELLGHAQCEIGQLEQAVLTLEQACKLNNQNPIAWVNLSNIHFRIGSIDKAIDCSLTATKLHPTMAESFLSLGNAYLFSKNYQDAEVSYKTAIEIDPNSADAVDNLAECYKKQGQLPEAINQHFRANEINPTLTLVYVHLVESLMYIGNREDALNVANTALGIKGLRFFEKMDLWLSVARYGWLSGNVALTKEALEGSKDIYHPDKDPIRFKNLMAYHVYLSKLLELKNDLLADYQQSYSKQLYFISDSHCLSPANIIVKFRGEHYKLLSSLIIGCKVWHLSGDQMNQYKASLFYIMASIPENSSVILGFGEIDCRADSGILPAYLTKGFDFRVSVPDMLKSYMEYATTLAKERNQDLIFCGVPAPSDQVLVGLSVEMRSLLIELIRFFNDEIKLVTQVNKFQYIDVYAATANDSGESNMKYHIDGHHLSPKLFPVLFKEYIDTPGLL